MILMSLSSHIKQHSPERIYKVGIEAKIDLKLNIWNLPIYRAIQYYKMQLHLCQPF